MDRRTTGQPEHRKMKRSLSELGQQLPVQSLGLLPADLLGIWDALLPLVPRTRPEAIGRQMETGAGARQTLMRTKCGARPAMKDVAFKGAKPCKISDIKGRLAASLWPLENSTANRDLLPIAAIFSSAKRTSAIGSQASSRQARSALAGHPGLPLAPTCTTCP